MEVKQFTLEDKPEIDSWYKERGMDIIPCEYVPKNGVIVKGHAAGWLYISDGNIAFVEGYISPQNISHADRCKALDLVTEALINKAKELGIKKLMAFTQSQSVYERGLRFGFDDIGSFRMLRLDFDKSF